MKLKLSLQQYLIKIVVSMFDPFIISYGNGYKIQKFAIELKIHNILILNILKLLQTIKLAWKVPKCWQEAKWTEK